MAKNMGNVEEQCPIPSFLPSPFKSFPLLWWALFDDAATRLEGRQCHRTPSSLGGLVRVSSNTISMARRQKHFAKLQFFSRRLVGDALGPTSTKEPRHGDDSKCFPLPVLVWVFRAVSLSLGFDCSGWLLLHLK